MRHKPMDSRKGAEGGPEKNPLHHTTDDKFVTC